MTKPLIFVTATRLSQAQFESGSPLTQSLRRLGQLTRKVREFERVPHLQIADREVEP